MRRSLIPLLCFLTPALAAPPEVAVVRPVEKEVTDAIDLPGVAHPAQSVEVRARVSGFIEKAGFDIGDAVKKGDVLFQLDDRVQRAELARAEAELAKAEARLKAAEVDHRRAVKLADAKAVSKEEVEKASAALEESRAALLATRAGIDSAKLNLEYTRVVSPIDGVVSRRTGTVGEIVRADTDQLATVITRDPIHIMFDLDERSLLRVEKLLRDRKDSKLPVRCRLGADKEFTREGVLDRIDPAIDAGKGTVKARAVLPNPKGGLRPGQFVRVQVPLGPPRKVLLVPPTALIPSGREWSVLVVTSKNSLAERTVKIGPEADGMWTVTDGLTADDQVVREPRGRKAGEEVKPREEKATPAKEKPNGGPGAAAPRPAPDFPATGPALVISALYPGADAHTVEDTVAGPIGKQLDGMDGVVSRVAACTDAGEMRMTVLFKAGTDMNVTAVLARDRVAVAEPVLPEAVQRQGVRVWQRPAYLLALAVLSPDGSKDRAYLTGYAAEQVRHELFRVPGVAEVTPYGDPDAGPRLRIQVDPDKLRAMNLTRSDVVLALLENNVHLADGVGLVAASPLPDLDKLGTAVVKAVPGGGAVRLRDVARFERVSVADTVTSLDGKPCVVLLVHRPLSADARETAKAVRAKVAELGKAAPAGVEVRVIDGGP